MYNHEKSVQRWSPPLTTNNDDRVEYYTCLAMAVLTANKEMKTAVLESRSNPHKFNGQNENWLNSLAISRSKGEDTLDFRIGHRKRSKTFTDGDLYYGVSNTGTQLVDKRAPQPLFVLLMLFTAFQILKSFTLMYNMQYIILEYLLIEGTKRVIPPKAIEPRKAQELPNKLSQQVPLWSTEDVREWVKQIGFSEYADKFVDNRVDGDLLLQLTEDDLIQDIGLSNGIRRRRFTRELQNLKQNTDYSSKDGGNLKRFLQSIEPEFSIYTYDMLNAGIDTEYLINTTEDQLELECGIRNSIHRVKIMEAIKNLEHPYENALGEKYYDVFISYRRSNGSQLASLLKVHLELRGFSVFMDVATLEAGKFDNNLLKSIKQAQHFLLVLTPQALERCVGDENGKDWVHKEIVTALNSQCNIIPIMDDFQFPEPETLPEDMRQVCHFNGVRWIHDYQDACVDKIERFVKGETPREENSLGGTSNQTNTRHPPCYQRIRTRRTDVTFSIIRTHAISVSRASEADVRTCDTSSVDRKEHPKR